ncbi:hypothetical protein BD309DRAFT_964650 [Dichomitus squalens]|nr:hypothetical protein BD309DRAFT_964650 [Dichomitus squalens]
MVFVCACTVLAGVCILATVSSRPSLGCVGDRARPYRVSFAQLFRVLRICPCIPVFVQEYIPDEMRMWLLKL